MTKRKDVELLYRVVVDSVTVKMTEIVDYINYFNAINCLIADNPLEWDDTDL